ncbi:MAG: HAD family hydrolase [Formosimonas sp.]
MVEVYFFDFSNTLFDETSSIDPEKMRLLLDEQLNAKYTLDDCRNFCMDIVKFSSSKRGVELREKSDLSMRLHREAWTACIAECKTVPVEFVDVFYDVFCNGENWKPFHDTKKTLCRIKNSGGRIYILSNIGWDIRKAFISSSLDCYIDGYVLSYECGLIKPDERFFEFSLKKAECQASQVLMVGDNEIADAGGVSLGIKTYILPSKHRSFRVRGLSHIFSINVC